MKKILLALLFGAIACPDINAMQQNQKPTKRKKVDDLVPRKNRSKKNEINKFSCTFWTVSARDDDFPEEMKQYMTNFSVENNPQADKSKINNDQKELVYVETQSESKHKHNKNNYSVFKHDFKKKNKIRQRKYQIVPTVPELVFNPQDVVWYSSYNLPEEWQKYSCNKIYQKYDYFINQANALQQESQNKKNITQTLAWLARYFLSPEYSNFIRFCKKALEALDGRVQAINKMTNQNMTTDIKQKITILINFYDSLDKNFQ